MLTAPNQPIVRQVQMEYYPYLQGVFEVGERYTTCFSRSERAVLRKKKYQAPSEWIPKNIKILRGEFSGNFFSYDITPHWRGMHDAAALPFIKKMVICGAAQGTAKTTGIDAWIAWSREFFKGDACSFYPDETTAKRALRERIKPQVEGNRALRSLVPKGRNAITDTRVEMAGGNWEVGWAGSLAQTADRSIKIVDMQEVDKPVFGKSGEETSAVHLLDLRPRSFPSGYKIFMSSSPSTEAGNVWVAIEQECEAVFVLWVTCPHCHNEILMHHDEDEERFYAPREVDEKGKIVVGEGGTELLVDRKTVKSKGLGRYICQECGAHWDDLDRNAAIKRCIWCLRLVDGDGEMIVDEKGEEMFRYLNAHRPATIGFIHPAWLSWFVSLSDTVHDQMKMNDPELSPEQQLSARKNFYNGQCSLPWKPKVELRRVDTLKDLRSDRPMCRVPSVGVVGLVAHVDTQTDDFWYTIMARGFGRSARSRHVVRMGRVLSFEDVAKVLWEDVYSDSEGRVYPIVIAGIDYQGDRSHEVIDFCKAHRGKIFPTRGEQHINGPPVDPRKMEYYPGPSKKPLPGGLVRLRVDTTYYKNMVHSILEQDKDDPGGMDFYKEVPTSYLQQLCVETRDEYGHWNNTKRADNHLFDNITGCLALEQYQGFEFYEREIEEDEEEDEVTVVTATLG